MLQNERVHDIATGREAQRRKTRARVLDAAIVEFQRAGAHSADINAIVEAAGVARSTFYFHFPSREHVLLELIRRDEDYLAEELSRFLDTRRDLPAVLSEIDQAGRRARVPLGCCLVSRCDQPLLLAGRAQG